MCIFSLDLFHSTEMRHSVTTPAYLFRKSLDNILYAFTADKLTPEEFSNQSAPEQDAFPTKHPSGWLPLYTMVTFRPDISYATVRRKSQRQSHILTYATWAATLAMVGTAGITCAKLWQRFQAHNNAV
jgi:kynurenine 3-monooxygenase